MNLDELKTVWQEYDSRLAATEEINQKVIASMIRERSVSRIARIRRRYAEMICLFLFYVVCLTGCFFGNPFDYSSSFQYLLLAALTLSCFLMAIFLFRARIALKKISLDTKNLQEALGQVITVYARYRKNFKYTIIVTFCFSLLLSLSRTIIRIAESGISAAILSVISFCVIIGFSYYYAGKKSEWPDLGTEEKGLRADIEELKDFGLK